MYYKGDQLLGGYSVYVAITKEREEATPETTVAPKKIHGVGK